MNKLKILEFSLIGVSAIGTVFAVTQQEFLPAITAAPLTITSALNAKRKDPEQQNQRTITQTQQSLNPVEKPQQQSEPTFTELPPEYPGLEELLDDITPLTKTNPAAAKLKQNIHLFLGRGDCDCKPKPLTPAWIDDIVTLGNRSVELDEGKSNYQAGTDFEHIVRDSLKFLGYTIDEAHKGGAGGLDLFCCQPYPLVGECKAGKKIPNDTAVQLLNLATLRLPQELLQTATKLIIGPGQPTRQLDQAAQVHGMAIINPETLEKLVRLQAEYPNSIDLFKLKEYLKPGKSDDEVCKYIETVDEQIKVRSDIV